MNKAEMKKVIDKYGPWTAHNIRLADGEYTITNSLTYDTIKLRRVIQIISDLCGGDLSDLRVLDLGSFEGLYALELGLQNAAEAVGIEGRTANLEKAEFARSELGLKNARFIKDDVRNICEKKYGRFDVILCLGLLYHLDAKDALELLEKMYSMCERFVIIDTHIALKPDKRIEYSGEAYFGSYEREFRRGLPDGEKEKRTWNALDNEKSFLFSKRSLLRALSHAGFTSTYECHAPFEYIKPVDRVTLLSVNGRHAGLATFPGINELMEEDIEKDIVGSVRRAHPAALVKSILKNILQTIRTITSGHYKE